MFINRFVFPLPNHCKHTMQGKYIWNKKETPCGYLLPTPCTHSSKTPLLSGTTHSPTNGLRENPIGIVMDSTAFTNIYGLFTNTYKQEFKVKALEDYANLYLSISGVSDSAFVEILRFRRQTRKNGPGHQRRSRVHVYESGYLLRPLIHRP